MMFAAACGGDSTGATSGSGGTASGGGTGGGGTPITAPPAAAALNAHQPATVGVALSYDATLGGTAFTNPKGGALRYTAVLTPSANGLVVSNAGRMSGTPLTSMVTSVAITAIDTAGATASQRFAVAAFASGLTLPTVTTAFTYRDAGINLPAHFTATPPLPPPGAPPGPPSIAFTDNSAGNPVTDAGAALGRVLFYDPRLSGNDRQACASCHIAQFGFSDTAVLSRGFQGGSTGRHSMGLANARYYQRGRFFWNERAATLEDQVLQPIQDATEMGMSLGDLRLKLAVTSYYPGLFSAAFGTSDITDNRIALALAQFVRSMSSYRSKYDGAFANGGPPNFAGVLSPDEEAGRRLFTGPAGCARCHGTDAQVMDAPHNIGLDSVTIDVGTGQGRFKSPSLRNVEVRGRYMHDGRFTTLTQVVDHYNTGVKNNVDLDPRLRVPGGQPQRLGLSPVQRAQIVAFLGALTDTAMLNAPKFLNPFAP